MPAASTIWVSPTRIVGHGTPGANGVAMRMSPTCDGCTHGAPTTRAIRPGVSRASCSMVACSRSQNHRLVTAHAAAVSDAAPPPDAELNRIQPRAGP